MGRHLLAVALVAIGTAGCGSGPATEAEADPPSGSWRLASGTGPGGTIDTSDAHRITLVFEADRLGGIAACNSYGASFDVDGDRLQLDAVFQTEMACEPPAMETERAYLQALQRAVSVRRDGDQLVLAGPSVELRFDPLPAVPARALLDTRWELDTVIVGETASSALEPAATLRLDVSDASLRGETGCRSFTGRYALAGDEIRVTELAVDDAATAGVCPPHALEQERVVLEVLDDRFRAEVEGDRLTLTSRGGYALVYRAR